MTPLPPPLLAAVAAKPADDLPRLVLADWLDDHGHPAEAELVRVQCHLEPRRGGVPHTDSKPLFVREQELLPRVRAGTVWPAAGENRLLEWVWGLPERLTLTADDLLENGPQVLDDIPTLRQVAVCDVRHRGPELAGCKSLGRVNAVEVADWLTPTDVAFLLQSRYLRGLPTLRLWAHRHEHATAFRHIDPSAWGRRWRVQVVFFDSTTLQRDDPRMQALRAAWGPDACTPVAPWERAFLVDAPPGGPDPIRTGTAPRGDGRVQLLALPVADGRTVVLEFGEYGGLNGSPQHTLTPAGTELDEWLAGHHRLQPGPIWVRSFAARSGHALDWLPATHRHGMNPLPASPDENGWSRRIKVWLAGGYALAHNWRGDGRADILDSRGRLCSRL